MNTKYGPEYYIGDLRAFLDRLRYSEYTDREGTSLFLFYDPRDEQWHVVSFADTGYCNNAACFNTKREAWRLYIDLIQPDLQGA